MAKGQKMETVIEKYGLKGLGDELVDRWTDPEEPETLYELEHRVNRYVVQTVIEEESEGLTPHEYPPGRIAWLLRADGSDAGRFDDVSRVEITQVTTWLKENDIEPSTIATDFVSYNTVYQYLTNIRNVDDAAGQRQSQTPEELQEKVLDRFTNMHQRAEVIFEQGLDSLVNNDILPDSYELHVQFRIECTTCDRRQDVQEYIRNSGCKHCDADH